MFQISHLLRKVGNAKKFDIKRRTLLLALLAEHHMIFQIYTRTAIIITLNNFLQIP